MAVLLLAGEARAEDKDKGEEPAGVSGRLGVELTYGQWARNYRGDLVTPVSEVHFTGTAPEDLWSWRGRFELIFGADPHFRGKLSPWLELSQPVEHSVQVVGSNVRFESAPMMLGMNVGLEYRFLRELLFIGLGAGVAHVIERVTSLSDGYVITPDSTRFSLLGSAQLGVRVPPFSKQFAAGATLSAEYHASIVATRFCAGVFIEWH